MREKPKRVEDKEKELEISNGIPNMLVREKDKKRKLLRIILNLIFFILILIWSIGYITSSRKINLGNNKEHYLKLKHI